MSFHQSSCNFSLNGTRLTAKCKRIDGSETNSSIDLNSLIANDEGQLVRANGGNFGASCTNIQLKDGTILTCLASKTDGSQAYAEIDLSSLIVNNDGQLQAS